MLACPTCTWAGILHYTKSELPREPKLCFAFDPLIGFLELPQCAYLYVFPSVALYVYAAWKSRPLDSNGDRLWRCGGPVLVLCAVVAILYGLWPSPNRAWWIVAVLAYPVVVVVWLAVRAYYERKRRTELKDEQSLAGQYHPAAKHNTGFVL